MALNYIYIPNIPQGVQQVNNTQPGFYGNFQDIATLMAVNHVPFNTADTFGRHNFVSYVLQDSDPSTSSTEMALYAKSVTNDSNLAELFYRYPNNGSVVQLTGANNNSPSTPTTGSGGYFSVIGGSTDSNNFGYPMDGYWQYLANNILMVTARINTYYTNDGATTPTSPFTIYFPSQSMVSDYTTNISGVSMPYFSQVYNFQITAGTYTQESTSCQYAGTISGSTIASIYYNGTIASAPSTLPGFNVTIIGV